MKRWEKRKICQSDVDNNSSSTVIVGSGSLYGCPGAVIKCPPVWNETLAYLLSGTATFNI